MATPDRPAAPNPAPASSTSETEGDANVDLVVTFLEFLAAGEVDRAIDLLSEDVQYTNVSLPTIRGRERVRRLGHATFDRPGTGFEVHFHAVVADDGVVLTERTDVMIYRRLRMQFWVYGRFEVKGGEITVWRDSFDWLNTTGALLRGLVGVLVPAVRPAPPRNASRQ